MKVKKTFQAEMDDVQRSVSQIVCWCTTIALHQVFGIGKIRLDRIKDRMDELEEQNTEVIMTPDANGRPSKQKAEAIRESWLTGIVESDYRIPMVRTPKNRKEEQYRIAGNRAATIAWQVYAKAVIDVLHYGPDRMKRLHKESHSNYEQLNDWGRKDGIDVAMEMLRRCAAEAMQADDLEVVDIDSSSAKKVDQELRRQQKEFARRVIAREIGKSVAEMPLNVQIFPESYQRMAQDALQKAMAQSFQRRRLDACK